MTQPDPADGSPAGPAVPPVPYGGPTTPSVTIEGQQVLVNGQPVPAGQQVDLSAYLSPEVAEQVRTSLAQLGLSGQFGEMFGLAPAVTGPATPSTVARLADPPRQVQSRFRLATFSWSWWEAFAIVLLTFAPIVVWGRSQELLTYALVIGVGLIAVFRTRTYLRRIGLLKWGKVATVTNTAELSRGTYYSGVTYNNMFMRQANGWDVTTTLYSGPGSTSKVEYSLDGVAGSVKLRGLPYNNGVVLADSRKPQRAMVVSQFPYTVKPDANGQLVGELSPWVIGGIIATLVLEGSLVYAAVRSVLDYWVS